MQDVSSYAAEPPFAGISARETARSALVWVWAIGFAVLMAAPVFAIVYGSFEVPVPGSDATRWGLDGWRDLLGNSRILKAVGNTLWLTVVAQAFALPIGLFAAWLLGRTDLPFRRTFEFCFWISFFLPSLAVLQGWILVADPHYGIANSLINRLFGTSSPVFDIYSFGGIVFAHLVTTTVSAKVMMLTPAFQNMDSRMEEAARVAGDSQFGVFCRVTVPVLAPTIVVTAIMGIIRSLESFEIELVLGGPRRIDVYNTLIYDFTRNDPVNYAAACALGIVVIFAMIGLVLVSLKAGRTGRSVTLSGQSKLTRIALGRWRIPAALLVGLVAAVLTIVPLGFLVVSSAMTMFGFFSLPTVWTSRHWDSVLSDPVFLDSVVNTLILSGFGAALCVIFSIMVAYSIVRSRHAARFVVDLASWIPFTMPGVLFSLAMLWLILGSGLTSLYGSTASLVITIAVASITLGVQLIRGNLTQISRELEEASWIGGASNWETILRIVLPLSIRSIAVVAVMSFIAAARDVSHLALLVSSDNRPLSILQLEYMLEGRSEASAVVGVIIVSITILAAILARALGSKFEAKA
ncbi:iron ABC transporter permease [Agrobacterium vitis]|uniref:ABC transporter permease n=1 Tax=Allorhizobium ampelinum TaxID=3025782 RepID=UPI001F1D6D46|nr:iron ABC transporter permease [Allorhizobium ampelinum]MCF1449894.1 iron ABC transporter permease [Allorhizobium ampelinum]